MKIIYHHKFIRNHIYNIYASDRYKETVIRFPISIQTRNSPLVTHQDIAYAENSLQQIDGSEAWWTF